MSHLVLCDVSHADAVRCCCLVHASFRLDAMGEMYGVKLDTAPHMHVLMFVCTSCISSKQLHTSRQSNHLPVSFLVARLHGSRQGSDRLVLPLLTGGQAPHAADCSKGQGRPAS